MSSLSVTICDGCKTEAPPDYSPGCPANHRWINVRGPDYGAGLDACSWDCLAQIVATHKPTPAEQGEPE